MEIEFQNGLQKAQQFGRIAQVSAGIVAGSSALTALGVTLYLNDLWPDLLIGTYDFHGLDMLVLADLILLIASFIIVGIWIHRAHANLLLTDAPYSPFTPGWAVGWFAIPIANLFKPFQAMKALWRASHGQDVDTIENAPGLMWIWWITWLVSGLSGIGDQFNALDAIAYAATSVSALCLIAIINQINEAQPTMSIASTFE